MKTTLPTEYLIAKSNSTHFERLQLEKVLNDIRNLPEALS